MSNRRVGDSTAKPLHDDLAAPRFPPPPRTPSLGVGARNVSGTQPRMDLAAAAAAQPTPLASKPAAALGATFRAEEAPSFDQKLTPVVPASWPDHEAVTATTRTVLEPAPTTSSQGAPAAALESTVATPSQPSVAISPSPAAPEHEFWNAEPKYSVPPARLVTDPPRPQPSLLRTGLTRLLFAAIVAVVLALLYYEACVAFHVPWQNPTLLVQRIRVG